MSTVQNETYALRAVIDGLAPTKTSRRYDEALEQRIAEHVRGRLSSGESKMSIRRSLDISGATLSRFLRRRGDTNALIPVHILPERNQRLTVRGPRGVEIEGDVEAIAMLLVRLAC